MKPSNKAMRRIALAALSILLTATTPVAAAEDNAELPALDNQLAQHPSPYLALHGGDSVAWQDWGPEVLQRARQENKLILLSSGYFSCHWCHVMQRESFQHPDIAALLNERFIPVKIDRELEPALDKRLMAYAQATLKRGGWPLNVFMSPDGLPVYAVLYQSAEPFMTLLQRLTVVWKEQSARIRELALQERQAVRFPDSAPQVDAERATTLQRLAVEAIISSGDDLQGGFGQSNKFPSTPQLAFLLESLHNSRNPEVIAFLELTLNAMADYGLRDQLGDGFYRYVVDPAWEIPHFEKMLYDNANLALLYLEAGAALDNPYYTRIARSTLDFMTREMANDEGALYASFSAVDDQDVEGGYYLWKTAQLKSVLDAEEYALVSTYWQTERPQELDGGNHLRVTMPLYELADALDISEQRARERLEVARGKLLAERDKRVLPTDDKLIAGWNGLALSAYSEAARLLHNGRYRDQAEEIRDFLVNRLWDGNSLQRSQAAGRLLGSASLEDYAYVARGLFDFAHLSGQEKDYAQAEQVLTQGWKRFYEHNAWSYADASLLPPAEGKEILSEDSSASPSAVLIATTLKLHNAGKLEDNTLYARALSALNRAEETLLSSPFWYVSQISAMQLVR